MLFLNWELWFLVWLLVDYVLSIVICIVWSMGYERACVIIYIYACTSITFKIYSSSAVDNNCLLLLYKILYAVKKGNCRMICIYNIEVQNTYFFKNEFIFFHSVILKVGQDNQLITINSL